MYRAPWLSAIAGSRRVRKRLVSWMLLTSKVEKGGDAAIKKWIREQLNGTSVTVVLVGSHTCASKYVQYEIEQSEATGNGLLGIDVSNIEDLSGNTTTRCGQIPKGYEFYLWNTDKGYSNMGDWIEKAAAEAGR